MKSLGLLLLLALVSGLIAEAVLIGLPYIIAIILAVPVAILFAKIFQAIKAQQLNQYQSQQTNTDFDMPAIIDGMLIPELDSFDSPPTSPLAYHRNVTTVSIPDIKRSNKPYVGEPYMVGFHGTPTIENVRNAVINGFIPGAGNLYGDGIYIPKKSEDAMPYTGSDGYLFKLFIRRNTPYHEYDKIPGTTKEEKHAWVMKSGNPLVYIRDKEWFVVFGNKGVPVKIPGLKSVEVYDHNHKRITV
jgi:hypothetical protein